MLKPLGTSTGLIVFKTGLRFYVRDTGKPLCYTIASQEAIMDIARILSELKAECARIDTAITALESTTAPGRRGRPAVGARTGRGPRHMSAAARKRISQAKKRWWAARKRKAAS